MMLDEEERHIQIWSRRVFAAESRVRSRSLGDSMRIFIRPAYNIVFRGRN